MLQVTSSLLLASRVNGSYSPSWIHHWLSKLRKTWCGMGGLLVGEKMCYDYKAVQWLSLEVGPWLCRSSEVKANHPPWLWGLDLPGKAHRGGVFQLDLQGAGPCQTGKRRKGCRGGTSDSACQAQSFHIAGNILGTSRRRFGGDPTGHITCI